MAIVMVLVGASAAAAASCGGDDPVTSGQDGGADTNDTDGDGANGEGGTDETGTDSGFDAGPACDPTTPCPGALTCCTDRCVDLKKNPRHCGACGVACNPTAQFCNSVECKDSVFVNVCESANATIVHDGITDDDNASGGVATALGSCTPTVAVRTVLQAIVESTNAGVLAAGGRPVTGPGDMFVATGGSFGQHAVGFLEKSATPVAVAETSTSVAFFRRSTSTLLRSVQLSELTATHDYALVELAVEPDSGTLTLIAYGLLSPGTRAAAHYAGQVIVPGRATYDQAYYLYEWTDGANGGNADQLPDTSEFTLVASGKW
jgi:hypothetical protein